MMELVGLRNLIRVADLLLSQIKHQTPSYMSIFIHMIKKSVSIRQRSIYNV